MEDAPAVNACEQVGSRLGWAGYSALMPAALMTSPQRLISRDVRSPRASGFRAPSAGITQPAGAVSGGALRGFGRGDGFELLVVHDLLD